MKKILAACALVGASLFVAGLAAEGLLRLGGFSAPIWYQPDPILGWSLRPGAAGWYTREGKAYAAINSAGFRDREHAVEKPAGVYRVAVLGDSVPEALQVDLQATFWWLLPAKLRGCAALAGRKVEMLNFGVSGYGTAQEAIQLERVVIAYQPDLVLLAFAPNDLRNNSSRLETERDRPFFVPDGAGLRLDDSFARDGAFRRRASVFYGAYRNVSDRLRIVQLLQAARHAVEGHHASAAQAAPVTPGVEPGADMPVFAPPRDAAWTQAWDVTERLIDRMHAFSAAHGARFMIAALTHSAQVDPDPVTRRNIQSALGVADLFYIERRLQALGAREGFDVVPLGPELQRRASIQNVHFHGFSNYHVGWGHWNEAGHRAAAEILAPQICAAVAR